MPAFGINGFVADFASLPGSPSFGEAYILNDTNEVAYFTAGWELFTPFNGWVINQHTNGNLFYFDSVNWINFNTIFTGGGGGLTFVYADGNVSTTYSANVNEEIFIVSSVATVTVTLPTTGLVAGDKVVIVDADYSMTSSNASGVDADGGDILDGIGGVKATDTLETIGASSEYTWVAGLNAWHVKVY